MYHFTFTITNAKKQFLGSCFFLPEKRSICSIRLFICFKVAKPIMTHMTTEKQTSNVIWRTFASVGVYNTPTQTNTHQSVVFYGLRGLSISVMVLYCTNRNFYRPTPNLHLNLPLTGNFVHLYHTHARTHAHTHTHTHTVQQTIILMQQKYTQGSNDIYFRECLSECVINPAHLY